MNNTTPAVETDLERKQRERKEAKQKEKDEAKAKEYWNSTVTRREAYEMVQQTYANIVQQNQLLMVQNTTLLEILVEKGVATAEEINEHSKTIIESIYGPVPTDEEGADVPTPSEEPK